MPIKQAIIAGSLETLQEHLHKNPSTANEKIMWGPIGKRNKSDPLHFLSDGRFHQIWEHEKAPKMARLLLESGAMADGNADSNESPLHGAASLGEPEVASVLLDFGADIEKTAAYPGIPDGTPLDYAVHFGIVSVIDLLHKRGARILSARMAAGVGDLEELKRRWNPAELSDVLRCACICDRVQIVEYLCSMGADINMDLDGATPLHWTAWEAKPRMIRYLLSKGAKKETKDANHQMTPVQWAKYRESQLGSRWGHRLVADALTSSS